MTEIKNPSIVTNIDVKAFYLLQAKLKETGAATIIYHSDCLDGSVAAFTTQVALSHKHTEFESMTYNDGLPYSLIAKGVQPQLVVMVDFSLPNDYLNTLVDSGHTVLVIDHHTSAIQKVIAGRNDGFFYFLSDELKAAKSEDKQSGASLAKFFMDEMGIHLGLVGNHRMTGIERLVGLAREHDLWLHGGDFTKDSMALSYWHGNKNANSLIDIYNQKGITEEVVNEMVTLGHKRLKTTVDKINDIIRCGCHVRIGNQLAWLYYCERAYTSLAGSIANKTYPISLSFYREGDKFKVSIRTSHDVDTPSANEMAEAFGGGGHKHAAGFYCHEYPVVLLSSNSD